MDSNGTDLAVPASNGLETPNQNAETEGGWQEVPARKPRQRKPASQKAPEPAPAQDTEKRLILRNKKLQRELKAKQNATGESNSSSPKRKDPLPAPAGLPVTGKTTFSISWSLS